MRYTSASLLITLLLISPDVSAQLFEKRIDITSSSTYNEGATALALKPNGNRLVAFYQYVSSTVPSNTALAEINANGDTLWTRHYDRGNYSDMNIQFIEVLPDGQVFMAGSIENGFAAVWLADGQGNISISRKVAYNTYREVSIRDVAVATDGSIFFAGDYFDFYSGGVSYYSWTVPLYGRLNADLTMDWVRTWGSTDHTNANRNIGSVQGIEVTPDGYLIVVGTEGVTHNVNLGTVQVAKVTQNSGAPLWTKQRPGLLYGSFVGLNIAPNGEIYTLTQMTNNTPFGGYDLLMEKFSPLGNFKWGKTFGTATGDYGARMRFNTNDHSMMIIGSHEILNNGNGALICNIDTSGAVQFAKEFGVPGSSGNSFGDVLVAGSNYLLAGYGGAYGGLLVQTDADGNTGCIPNSVALSAGTYAPSYTTGITHSGSSVNITASPTATTFRDLSFTTSCYACSDVFSTVSVAACGSHFVGGAVQTSSGTYTDTYLSMSGCDSVVTTVLTIHASPSIANAGPDQSICLTSAALSANVPQVGTGQWSLVSGSGTLTAASSASSGVNGLAVGDNIFRWTISNGSCTASTNEVTITVNEATAATLTTSACSGFTLNGTEYTASGTYTQTLTNEAGCDSTLTLELTIVNVDATVTVGNATFFAEPSDAAYQWIDCDNGNAAITGAIEQTYTPGDNGMYAVIVSLNGCTDTSGCVSMFTIGITDASGNQDVVVYPNPTRSDITIGSTALLTRIELMDNTGRVIISQPTSTLRTVLSLGHLAPGSYVLRLTDADGPVRYRSVVRE